MSAFVLEDGVVYHTYSAYARGLDGLWAGTNGSTSPKGRNEARRLVAPPRRVRDSTGPAKASRASAARVSVNYRRVLEIQAWLLARAATGELARYPGFETR